MDHLRLGLLTGDVEEPVCFGGVNVREAIWVGRGEGEMALAWWFTNLFGGSDCVGKLLVVMALYACESE